MEKYNNINFVALIPKTIFYDMLKQASPLEIAIARMLTNICSFIDTDCVIYESSYGARTFQNWFRAEYIIDKAKEIAKENNAELKLTDNINADIAIAERNLHNKILRLQETNNIFIHEICY